MSKKKERIILAVILMIISVNGFWYGHQKSGYHIDEMYSYGLANSNYRPFLHMGETDDYNVEDFMLEYGTGNNAIHLFKNVWNDIVILSKAKLKFKQTEIYSSYLKAQKTSNDTLTTTWLDGDYFNRYLTVEKGTGFNIASVYYNQRGDVHPPLYYLLLHTISSFFPNTFSKWFAFSVNFAVLIGALILLYYMLRRYIGSYLVAYGTVAIYGMSSGFISTLDFFRMYALLTFITVAYCYFFLFMNEKGWKFSKKNKFVLIFLTIAGFYTQYFFVLYAFSMALLVGVILIINKKYKVIWTYLRQLIYSSVIGLIIWPFCLKHVFGGYQGKHVQAAFLDFASIPEKIKGMCGQLSHACLGNQLYMFWILLFMAIGGVILRRIEGKKDMAKYFILFLPAGMYFIFTSVAAPFVSDRYIMNIMPFVMIMLVLSVNFWMVRIPGRRQIRTVTGLLVLFVLFLMTNCYTEKPNYVSDYQQENVKIPQKTTALYVLGNDVTWPVYTKDALLLMKCERVMILFERDLSLLEGTLLSDGGSLMIIMNNVQNQEAVLDGIEGYINMESLVQEDYVYDMEYGARYLFR